MAFLLLYWTGMRIGELLALTYNAIGRKYKTVDVYKRQGMVYEVKPELGVFIAVDRRYYGMIPAQEVYETYRPGDEVTARVLKIRNDGKLDLSARRKAHAQMNEDAEKVWPVSYTHLDVYKRQDQRYPRGSL